MDASQETLFSVSFGRLIIHQLPLASEIRPQCHLQNKSLFSKRMGSFPHNSISPSHTSAAIDLDIQNKRMLCQFFDPILWWIGMLL